MKNGEVVFKEIKMRMMYRDSRASLYNQLNKNIKVSNKQEYPKILYQGPINVLSVINIGFF